MYEIKKVLLDFPEKEIGAGAEMAASEPQKVEIIKDEVNSELNIEGNFPGTGGWGSHLTHVVIDEKNGEVVKTRCSCDQFHTDTWCCSHVLATLFTYIEKRDGRDALAGSRVAKILEKRTGIMQPYRTGILRKTERNLTALLSERQSKHIPVMMEDNFQDAALGSLRVECFLQKQEQYTRLELKAGNSRLYVIKEARTFLDAYMKHEQVQLGKSLKFVSRPEVFETESRKKMDFLLRMYRQAEAEYGGLFFESGYGNDARYMILSGEKLDRFMEQFGAGGVFISGDEKNRLFFESEPCELPMEMNKLEFGAVMQLESVDELGKSVEYLYWIKNGRIFRTVLDQNSQAMQMLDLLKEKEEVYVSEKDLPAVCREFLPALSNVTAITYKGMNIEDYLPEKPVIEIYLDYPQELMVTCKVYAKYKAGKYQLFLNDSQNDSRDYITERETGEEIKRYFQSFDQNTGELCMETDEAGLYNFLTEAIPQIEKLGEVFISDKMNKLRVIPLNNVSVGVSVESGLMNLEMKSDRFTNDELAEILSSYNRKAKFRRLKNGTFVTFNAEQNAMWSALADCMDYADKNHSEIIRMPLFRAMYLDEMLKERDAVDYNKSREYRRLLRNMQSVEDAAFDVPDSLKDIMRDYQKDGFVWLKVLKNNGFGGILADDMGLGKTLQILSFLLSEKEEGKKGEKMRTLIVTPASLVYNWKKEFRQYVPDLNICVIGGSAAERKHQIEQLKDSEEVDVWITSYDLLKRDIDLYEDVVFANQIIDEAQYIKNQTTNAAKSVRLINSSFRMALTGTPIENRLSELWSIFDYLMPGFLYKYSRFRTEIELPVVSDKDEEAMEKMRRMIHPFILRRLKKDVLKELPDKQEEIISVQLEGEQRKQYDAHVQRLKMYLEKQNEEEFSRNKIEILAELTKLRQLCCGPELFLEGYKGPNAKLDTCLELIHQAIEGGHKILLFSQFTTMLDGIGKKLKEDGISYYRIDGSVKKEDRMELVEAFQKDDTPVFCISLKAGGTGLNLTAADIVIHYDPWWNVAAQNQATDRAHRIGQVNPVNVYQLIAEDTIEQKIRELQESKEQLANEVLSGEAIQSIRIDKDEIMKLLNN